MKFSLRTELIPYRLQEKPQKIQKTVRNESAGSEKEEGSGDTGEAAADKDKENEDAAENTSDEKPGLQKEEKISYALDGKEIEETVFTTFYNKLINMAGQERLTEVVYAG